MSLRSWVQIEARNDLCSEDDKMAEVDFTTNGSDAQFGDSQEMYEGIEGAGNAGGDVNPGDKINASKNDDDERYCSIWLHTHLMPVGRHFEFLGKKKTREKLSTIEI